jgi:predicted  nucleic acid-binding Zn-ribbon protein
MSDPMTRRAAIDRIVAMRSDFGQTWDLSEKDQEALRHAIQAFSDADRLESAVRQVEETSAELQRRVEAAEHKLVQIRTILANYDPYESDYAFHVVDAIEELKP